MEAIESGSSLFLIDEDTSATNFMIRDRLMQQVISPKEEPITPFINRVNSLYQDLGISTVLVAGSSGSYFHVADHIVQMKEYVPIDITEKAKEAAQNFAVFDTVKEAFPDYVKERRPKPDMALKKEERLKIKAMGRNELLIAKNSVELRYMEQLNDEEQTMALGFLLKQLELNLFDGRKTLVQAVDMLEEQLNKGGLESLFGRGEVSASLARPRRQEIFACVDRYRKLYF